ncbi:hypothetical protein Saratov12_00005 [Vibrio phage Saratov-12]|nr:hypothetical protein Saratov12_00005 [Vibrio phage Saratov-12]QNL29718.1 hypothetical protein Saratov15_00018 [Vibrio phage Saratov-15]WJJ54317.1 hypothetical protein [Vibrio phage JPW]
MKKRNPNRAHSPERLMLRKQTADVGLIKVVNLISRATGGAVLGGRLGFICAAIKQDGANIRSLSTWEAYGQVYDSVTTMAIIH